jgi:serine phosphatase RsbU (regulator of sigma subunit)
MDDAFYLRGLKENRLVMRKQISLKNAEPTMPAPGGAAAQTAGSAKPQWEVEHKLALSEQVLNSMAQELCVQVVNAKLAKEQLDNRLLARELEIARNIQQSLLPKTFPSLRGLGLAGFCLSARQVGGDFFDVLRLSDQSVLLVVADVMGKGVPAALFAATLRTLVRTTVNWTRRPSELLRRINHHMFEELSGVDMFITAQLALVDLAKNTLTVANAGHCPLLLTNKDAQTISVSPEGMPLGIMPEMQFVDQSLPLEGVHSVLLYTDGLTEARNPDGEWFGRDRLLQWLSKATTTHQKARDLSDAFLREFEQFQSSASIKDDQTFLILAAEEPVDQSGVDLRVACESNTVPTAS